MNEFREWLVGWTLREISDLFEGHGFTRAYVPAEELPGGERRGLVECYYRNINVKIPDHVRRLMDVYSDVLFPIPDQYKDGKQRLIRYLERDGFKYRDDGRIELPPAVALAAIPQVGLDTAHLDVYLGRINASVENDPELAIGSAKDLVEGTLKSILSGLQEPFDEKSDDVHALLKKVQKRLDLAPDSVDAGKRGAEIIKRTLSNLGQVVVGVFELRNLYGSGHGRTKRTSIDARLAKLAVGTAGTLCRFLLETYEQRTKR
jgi:hypothetical protein